MHDTESNSVRKALQHLKSELNWPSNIEPKALNVKSKVVNGTV